MKISSAIICLILFFKLTQAQVNIELINSYLFSNQFYPVTGHYFLFGQKVSKDILSIEVLDNDTDRYELSYSIGKLISINMENDSVRIRAKYCLGSISKLFYYDHKGTLVYKYKVSRLLPFHFGGRKATYYIHNLRIGKKRTIQVKTDSQTFFKAKIQYKKKNYLSSVFLQSLQPVSQEMGNDGYTLFSYPSDTIVIIEYYDHNDSLAYTKRFTFDEKANILTEKTITYRRTKGYGVDVITYAYDGSDVDIKSNVYKFDDKGNWIRRDFFVNDTLRSKTSRIINYKE